MASITIYDHLQDESRHHVLELLKSHLPISLPLYRRIQFQHFTATSHLLCSLSLAELRSGTTDKPWIAAYVDRSRRPETEVWPAASWQSDTTAAATETETEWMPQAQELTRALVDEVARIGLPDAESPTTATATTTTTTTQPSAAAAAAAAAAAPAQDSAAASGGGGGKSSATQVDRAEYAGHLKDGNIAIFGSVHERTVAAMTRIGALAEGYVGADIPYRKYIFDLGGKSTSKPGPPELPPDLVWGRVQPRHFDLVKSRTMIPRQDSTLRQIPSMALYPKDKSDPISWTFLAPDASLASLHVEPEYRGRGLAKMVAAKMFADGMAVFGMEGAKTGDQSPNDEDRWAHADVAVDNVASNAVCKSLGGESAWQVYWIRVDLVKS
ncbi:hypothetical protein MBLNU459_g4663t1 [Dothideomycetes sp. NU459]